MIKRLQKRMVLLVLAGLLLASAGLVFAINWINWQSIRQQAEGILDMLAENDGQRPLVMERMSTDNPDETPPPRPENDGEYAWRNPPEDMQAGRWNSQRGRMQGSDLRSAASLISSYTIELDASGAVTGWNSDRAELYGEEDIAALAAQVLAQGTQSGRIDTQFYRLIPRESGQLLIVVDQRLAMQDAQRVLRLTLLFAGTEDALLAIGAVLLIRRMVRPVDEAMEKQKQFVWDASHELKTPLAVISANAEALAGEVGENSALQYIQSEVQRSDQLIQSLLTLARMEKGTVKAEPRPFDLSHALLSVILPFESAIFEDGKTLETDIPEGILYTGDAEMIKQLCVILLSNAQKYSGPHGAIDLKLEARGDRRILQVHNTGPAIPPEAQSKIFDRFYRVDSSHNSEIPGNGLGLAIARSIVDAHKGKIAVRSAEGEGTTFTVTL